MRNFIPLLLILLVLSGCYLQGQQNSPLNVITIVPTIQIAKEAPHPTNSLLNTSSPTSSPTPAILTTLTTIIIPTQTNSLTAVVTLTKEEAKTTINVLRGSKECVLPCWLGLKPGVSTFYDIKYFAARLGLEFQEEKYNKNDDLALLYVTNTESLNESPTNKIWNPVLVDVYWKKGVVNLIIIRANEYPAFLSVDKLRYRLGDPDHIFLWGPFGNEMGFILDYRSLGFAFALNSVTSKQATICPGDSLDKSIILEIYDPADPVDISNQTDLFGDLVWETQANPGYSPKEIMDKIVSKECLHFLDFSKQW